MTLTPADAANEWVRPINQIRLSDVPSVGGKAANLGELTSSGFPVPSGFVVTKDAYLAAMDRAGIRDTLRARRVPPAGTGEDELTAAAGELRALVLDAPVPDTLQDLIVAAYLGLGDAVPVAVRSSAPGEDAADTSFAGIHDSFTSIVGPEALTDALRRCWASLWSERALTYRSVRSVDEEPSIAVIVQTMVSSERSGVAFTADPRTGDRDRLVIEAATGLGEVVVGGQVEPDTYVLDKDGLEILDLRIGAQDVAVTVDGGGEHRVEIPMADRGKRVLTDSQIEHLGGIALAVEKHYGAPQDIEFAFSGDQLWLVQTRPVTTLGGRGEGDGAATVPGSRVLVRGLGASPGTASGPARVLQSVADAHRLHDGDILVAPMTRPDWLPVLRRAAAIVTDGGGITCHAAIVGRELGRPVVVGTRNATTALVDGMLVTVDGDTGNVSEGTGAARQPTRAATSGRPERPGGAPSGEPTATAVYVNLATPEAADRVAATDVDGVGLLRAEFMITDALHGTHPARLLAEGRRDEYVQKMAEGVHRIAAAFAPRPVVYRAIDLRTNEFANLEGGEAEPAEDNPMIGYRGCYRYVREPELFTLDLDVVHAVRQRCPNLHLMIPFVRTGWELEHCLRHLDAHPLGSDRRMLRWIMAEVPSVTYWIPHYAGLGIDGLSIGSNDLTQLVLGVDRDSDVCRELFDTMDPSVLDAIDTIIDRATSAGLTTSLCGQAVSTDPALAEHLIRRGITSVSVTPDVAERTRRAVATAERRIMLEQARSPMYEPRAEHN